MPYAAAPPSDRELVDAVQRAEREAFDALYARWLPRVHAWLRRRVTEPAALERAIARTLERVLSELPHWDRREPFEAFVLRAARASLASQVAAKRVPGAAHRMASG